MTSSLEDLCENFCAAAQVAAPELSEDGDGVLAFTIFWRDVEVDLMAKPSVDPALAYVIFHFGTPNAAHSDYARILLALLHTNFGGMQANQPVLSCHPETHEVMLQWVVPLTGMASDALYPLIEKGVALALQWRQTYFLAPAAHDTTAASAAPLNRYA